MVLEDSIPLDLINSMATDPTTINLSMVMILANSAPLMAMDSADMVLDPDMVPDPDMDTDIQRSMALTFSPIPIFILFKKSKF